MNWLVLGVMLLGATAGDALRSDLQEHLARLAHPSSNVLEFVETRESGLLAEPVTYRGRLEYVPESDTFTKWIDTPRQARLSITPDAIEMQSGGGPTRRLGLSSRPDLAALLAALRALFAGDTEMLERVFVADFLAGEGDQWVLHLKPREAEVASSLQLLEIRGVGEQLSTIATVLGDGSRQETRILEPTRKPE